MRFLTHPGGSIAIVEWPLKSSAPAFPRAFFFFITTVQASTDFQSVARRLTRPLDSSRFVWLRSGIRSTTTEFPFRDDPILSSRPPVFSPRLLKRFCRWFCLAAVGRLFVSGQQGSRMFDARSHRIKPYYIAQFENAPASRALSFLKAQRFVHSYV